MKENFSDSKKENKLNAMIGYGSYSFLKRFGKDILNSEECDKRLNAIQKESLLEYSEKVDKQQYKEMLIGEIRRFILNVEKYFFEKNDK